MGNCAVKIKLINREALDCQTAVEQPTVWRILRITVGFIFLLEIARIILFPTSSLPSGTAYQVFRVVSVISVYTFWTLIAFAFKNIFPEALNFPARLIPKKWITEVLILVFAILFLTSYAINIWKLDHNLMHLITTSKGHQKQFQQIIIQTHDILWKPEHFGSDVLGVVLGSVSVLLAPIFEELFFRGYMLNRLCQSYHPLTAIFVSAFWFATAHIFSKSVDQLPMVFLLGFCCGIVRLQSGRWQDALKLHFLYNFCIIAPKIGFAVFRFHVAS
jgi:membrane protease YdiL (CAAX protease family)